MGKQSFTTPHQSLHANMPYESKQPINETDLNNISMIMREACAENYNSENRTIPCDETGWVKEVKLLERVPVPESAPVIELTSRMSNMKFIESALRKENDNTTIRIQKTGSLPVKPRDTGMNYGFGFREARNSKSINSYTAPISMFR